MNAACIIAACAASARNAAKAVNNHCSSTEEAEVYYKVKLRKYYHFEAMNLISYEGEYFTGSVYAPVITPFVRPVKVPARTIAIENSFYVAASKCPKGVDRYIKDNLDDFSASVIWQTNDQKVLNKYINELNSELKIDLDPKSLTYTTQYCWEVH